MMRWLGGVVEHRWHLPSLRVLQRRFEPLKFINI